MNPDELGPEGLPLDSLPLQPEDEQNTANRFSEALGGTGDVVGGTVEGIDLIGGIGEGISGAASAAADAVESVASGAAEAVGGAAEGIGSVVEGVGAVAEGCGSCSLAVFLMLASVGAAVAAVLR